MPWSLSIDSGSIKKGDASACEAPCAMIDATEPMAAKIFACRPNSRFTMPASLLVRRADNYAACEGLGKRGTVRFESADDVSGGLVREGEEIGHKLDRSLKQVVPCGRSASRIK